MANYGNLPKFEFIVVTISAFLIAIFLMQMPRDGQNSQPFTVQLKDQKNHNSSQPQISARSALVLDKTTGSIIFSKNPNLRFTPASATKIMTAYVALKLYTINEIITITDQKIIGSTMGLLPREKITVENLLYGMLLNSGNDAAYALAEHHPRGLNGFVNEMNKTTRELDLTNTVFADPAGLSDDGNFTTTYDLAKLALETLKNPIFAKIVSTREKTVTDTSGNIRHELKNLNKLLWDLPGVNGVKTGFTDRAGGVLVTSFDQGETKLVTVVFKSEDRFADTQELIDWVVGSKKGQ